MIDIDKQNQLIGLIIVIIIIAIIILYLFFCIKKCKKRSSYNETIPNNETIPSYNEAILNNNTGYAYLSSHRQESPPPPYM